MSPKIYKDYKIYSCFVLNQLVSALGINIYQDRLEEKLDEVLLERIAPLSKSDIMHEIKSNHHMTNKIICKLETDGFIRVTREEKKFQIEITREGILHVRKYNQFYLELYKEQIQDHYRYRGVPGWVRSGERNEQL